MAHDLEALHQRFGRYYPQWLLAVLMLSTMSVVLSSTSINVALPSIMDDFVIGRPLAQWLATGFLAAMTAGLLLTAWAQARFGARRTTQAGLLLFCLVSLLALLANSAAELIAVRVIQGLCAGVVQPLATVLIFRVFAGGGRGAALGLYVFGVMLAPSLGPAVGGYLVDHFGWQAIFWMPLPLCVLVLLASQWLLPDEAQNQVPRLDLQAFAWLCIAIFALLGCFAEAQRFPWAAPRVWGAGLLGVGAATLFIRRTRRAEQPLLPLGLWRHPGFRSASWVALTLGFGLYASTYLIPLYLQTVEGFSAGDSGMLLLPAGLLMGLASLATGLLTDRLPSALLLGAGLLLFALGSAGMAWLDQGAAFALVCLWACVGRIGLGMILPALNTGSLDILSSQELAQGAGAITFVRQLGGAFGVNLLTFFLEWRERAGGGDPLAEVQAFKQGFWLMAAVFLLTLIAARGVKLTRR